MVSYNFGKQQVIDEEVNKFEKDMVTENFGKRRNFDEELSKIDKYMVSDMVRKQKKLAEGNKFKESMAILLKPAQVPRVPPAASEPKPSVYIERRR